MKLRGRWDEREAEKGNGRWIGSIFIEQMYETIKELIKNTNKFFNAKKGIDCLN